MGKLDLQERKSLPRVAKGDFPVAKARFALGPSIWRYNLAVRRASVGCIMIIRNL